MKDRELDALVAERVMGWRPYIDKRECWAIDTPCDIDNEHPRGRETLWTGERAWGFDEATGKRWDRPWWGATQEVPFYSTDITAAWQVVEAMRATNYRNWRVESFAGGTCAAFWTDNEDPDELTRDAADEVSARAICLAALKALGVDASSPAARKENEG